MAFMVHDDVTRASTVGSAVGGEALESLGRFRDLHFLGQGGMARVYSAYDPLLRRSVALKLIRGDDPELRVRLQAEARSQASIDHPGVCKIFEVGEVDSEPYIAMQLIHGPSLREAATEMTLEQKLNLMKEVSLAVHAAHRAGLIHRDLKPANILVEKTEDARWIPYVVDFGLAREAAAPGTTATGIIVGSPAYMAPEQARGEIKKLDRRSDVYSLGVTLYELLSGTLPYNSDSTVELLLKVLNEDPVPLRLRDSSLPEEVQVIVMKCLEKDPSQRYESARAFAEDLERYLSGDPIRARPAGLTYRLGKKIRKHRALVATAAVAAVLILILGGLGLRARFTARQQAELANQLGQEVKEIESILRFAQMLPLHDVAPEKRMVRERIARIENRISNMGALAAGPGNYAIGRGYMALQEYTRARQHLESAWKSYRDPQVATALGLVMGILYQKDLEEADLIPNKELREARRRKSEADYRVPALEYLKAGSQRQNEYSDYVQGIIAFYEKDYSRALKSALEAARKAPWFFEAHQLSGEIHLAQGKAAAGEGRHKEALACFDQSENEFRVATMIARSNARSYLGLCSGQLARLEAAIYSNPEGIEQFARQGLELCAQALQSDSEFVDAMLAQARLYIRWGEHIGGTGGDPRDLLNRGINMAQQTIAVQPDNYIAYQNAGIAYRLSGRYEKAHGLDPRASLDKAIAAYRRSIEINPAYPHTYSSLANAYIMRGEIEWERGSSPLDSLDAAIQNLNKALELDPKFSTALNNLGVAYNDKSAYELSLGRDPQESVAASIRALTRALELKPNDALLYSNLGNPYLYQGQYIALTGGDPGKYFLSAMENYGKAAEMNPNLANAVVNLGLAHKNHAMYLRDTGKDAGAEFHKAVELCMRGCEMTQEPFACSEAALAHYEYGVFLLLSGKDPLTQIREGLSWSRQALSLHSDSAEALSALASVKLLEARRKIARKENGAASIQEAERAALKALQLTPDYIPFIISAAQIYCAKAQAAQQQGTSPEETVQKGLQQVQDGLAISGKFAELHALRGALLSFRAAHGDTEAAAAAREALQHALQTTPYLERHYGTYLQQLN